MDEYSEELDEGLFGSMWTWPHMTLISFEDNEIPICNYYLRPFRRDDVARELGVGAGTVSRTWQKIQALMGQDIASLRELSQSLSRSNYTVNQAIDGYKLRSFLAENGVQDDDVVRTLAGAVAEVSRDSTIDVTDLLISAKKMIEIERRESKTYPEQIVGYAKLLRDIQEIQRKVVALEEERRRNEEARNEALTRNKVTEQQLKEYTETRDDLRNIGADIDDLTKVTNMLKNANESDFDRTKIIKEISQHESLSGELSKLRTEINQEEEKEENLGIRIQNLERKLKTTESTVSNQEALLASLRGLVDKEVESMETNIGDLVTTLNSEISAMKLALQQANPQIKEFSNVIAEADRVSANIAQFGFIQTAKDLISDGKGGRVDVLTLILQVLTGFKKWLSENKESDDLASLSSSIISRVDEELKRIGK